MPDYPAAHSMDSAWFAVDEAGRVAIFDTGEPGAIPTEALIVWGEGEQPEARGFVDSVATAVGRRALALGPDTGEGEQERDAPDEYPLFESHELSLLFLSDVGPFQSLLDSGIARPFWRHPEADGAGAPEIASDDVAILQAADGAGFRHVLAIERAARWGTDEAALREAPELIGVRDVTVEQGTHVFGCDDYGAPGHYSARGRPEVGLLLDDLPERFRRRALRLPLSFEDRGEVRLEEYLSDDQVETWGDVPLGGEPEPGASPGADPRRDAYRDPAGRWTVKQPGRRGGGNLVGVVIVVLVVLLVLYLLNR